VFEVHDSPLSEAGGSVRVRLTAGHARGGITDREAQFGRLRGTRRGDHAISFFASRGEWNRVSGLVMLRPHGRRGRHRALTRAAERFLNMCVNEQHAGLQPDDAGAAIST